VEANIEIIDCEQGAPEWHQLRSGVITASMFSVFLDKLKTGKDKGGYKKAAHDYAFRLACERIAGEPLDEGMFETWAMRRGKELESAARSEHALRICRDVDEAGFVRTSDGKFGASADGLIGEKGGAEYKCLIDPARLKSIIIDHDIDEFLPQVQACLWLTGRAWWHFVLYCPALEPAGKQLTIFEVHRNEEYIENIEKEALLFDDLVESYKGAILAHDDDINPASIKT